MGAGGSTAVSCSSVDVSQQHKLQSHQRNHRYRRHQHQKLMHKLASDNLINSQQMRHSYSYFDLSQHDLVGGPVVDAHDRMGWLDASHPEGFSIAGPVRPVVLLAGAKPVSSSPSHPQLRLQKRSNAGVANRIQQMQQMRQMKKLSDSMPSLDNLHEHQPFVKMHQVQHKLSLHPNSNNSNMHRRSGGQWHRMNRSPTNLKSAQSIQPKYYKDAMYFGDRDSNIESSKANQLSPFTIEDSSFEQQRQMKRAISLSSLHNLHSQQQVFCLNGDVHPKLQAPFYRRSYLGPASDENGLQNNHHDLQHSNCDKFSPAAMSYHKSQQSLQYSQYTPLAKKIMKFKQVATGHSSKKYKQKQKLQQSQQQQQGCPVLPPLPRSQSLHDVIQLRATENGQRMRTTGTLRGPLNGSEVGTKVNLVVELLENRRQQKLSETTNQIGNIVDGDEDGDLATMISHSSSTDDGIHDESISVNQSTGDSRQYKSSNDGEYAKNSLNSGQYSDSSGQQQRVYLRNSKQLPANKSQAVKRFNGGLHRSDENAIQRKPVSNFRMKIEQRQQRNQEHKSTLKRSSSHSALQDSRNFENQIDADESDDLNELAKFLYQFKQRQVAATKAAAINTESGPAKLSGLTSQVQTNGGARGNQHSDELRNKNPTMSNQQQSPNSTTSSSGFASSTCTSNSISSSKSEEPRCSRLDQPSETLSNCGQPMKKTGLKKYPAPPIPCKIQTDSTLETKTNARNSIVENEKSKPLSPLVSMVSEYNSEQSKESSATKLFHERSEYPKDGNPTPEYEQQLQQINRLHHYTKMRQMSQSEIALNHLTSSISLSNQPIKPIKQDGSKPYKSKIISIIRRIGDKTSSGQIDGGCKSASVLNRTTNSTQGCLVNSVGGQLPVGSSNGKAERTKEIAGVINQSGVIALNPNQFKHQAKHHHALYSKASNSADGIQPSNNPTTGCLSESLSDLNFDCDFELIKKCGNANEHRKALANAAKGSACNSLLSQRKCPNLPANDGSPNRIGGPMSQRQRRQQQQEKVYQKEASKKQCQFINSSKGENNWQLAPASYSFDKPDPARPDVGKVHHRQDNQSIQCDPERASSADNRKEASSDKSNQLKLKWSASNWLMNGRGAACSKDKHQPVQQAQKPDVQASGKSRLSKLISSGKSSASKKAICTDGRSPVAPLAKLVISDEQESSSVDTKAYAKVNSEANQLLDELDKSLDLVSIDNSLKSRNRLTSTWWNFGANKSMGDPSLDRERIEMDGSGTNFGDSSDEDDYEEAYTSSNRALIMATFDVNVSESGKQARGTHLDTSLGKSSVKPGSPSNSFTFSMAGSPIVADRLDGPRDTANNTRCMVHDSSEQMQASGHQQVAKQVELSECEKRTSGQLMVQKEELRQTYTKIRSPKCTQAISLLTLVSASGNKSTGKNSGCHPDSDCGYGRCGASASEKSKIDLVGGMLACDGQSDLDHKRMDGSKDAKQSHYHHQNNQHCGKRLELKESLIPKMAAPKAVESKLSCACEKIGPALASNHSTTECHHSYTEKSTGLVNNGKQQLTGRENQDKFAHEHGICTGNHHCLMNKRLDLNDKTGGYLSSLSCTKQHQAIEKNEGNVSLTERPEEAREAKSTRVVCNDEDNGKNFRPAAKFIESLSSKCQSNGLLDSSRDHFNEGNKYLAASCNDKSSGSNICHCSHGRARCQKTIFAKSSGPVEKSDPVANASSVLATKSHDVRAASSIQGQSGHRGQQPAKQLVACCSSYEGNSASKDNGQSMRDHNKNTGGNEKSMSMETNDFKKIETCHLLAQDQRSVSCRTKNSDIPSNESEDLRAYEHECVAEPDSSGEKGFGNKLSSQPGYCVGCSSQSIKFDASSKLTDLGLVASSHSKVTPLSAFDLTDCRKNCEMGRFHKCERAGAICPAICSLHEQVKQKSPPGRNTVLQISNNKVTHLQLGEKDSGMKHKFNCELRGSNKHCYNNHIHLESHLSAKSIMPCLNDQVETFRSSNKDKLISNSAPSSQHLEMSARAASNCPVDYKRKVDQDNSCLYQQSNSYNGKTTAIIQLDKLQTDQKRQGHLMKRPCNNSSCISSSEKFYQDSSLEAFNKNPLCLEKKLTSSGYNPNQGEDMTSGSSSRIVRARVQEFNNISVDVSSDKHSKDSLFFGKLRNSLLSQKKEVPMVQLSKASKLATSQLSLGGCYSNGLICDPSLLNNESHNNLVLSKGQQLQQKLNADFDDNFILRRKTPNAGLKTRC